jgi:tRNA A-37 threonylcarbamoyl transferase component Bud32
VFRRLGVPAPEPLVWAEARDGLGRLRGALILTAAVPEAVTLEAWLCANAGSAARALRREIMVALAGQVRTLHASGFAHHDLVGRNLLVAPGPKGKLSLAWIDCPRGRFTLPRFVRLRQQVKDLAALDKTGVRHCSRSERLRFALRYLDCARLDEAAKRMVRAVIRYGRRRWPDDF